MGDMKAVPLNFDHYLHHAHYATPHRPPLETRLLRRPLLSLAFPEPLTTEQWHGAIGGPVQNNLKRHCKALLCLLGFMLCRFGAVGE